MGTRLICELLRKGIYGSGEKKWSQKITFHVWSLTILLGNTARVKMLLSIMKMQILDQKMPDHELSRFISGFFCTFVTHPSKSVLSVFSSLDLNIITDITKLLFLAFKVKIQNIPVIKSICLNCSFSGWTEHISWIKVLTI